MGNFINLSSLVLIKNNNCLLKYFPAHFYVVTTKYNQKI